MIGLENELLIKTRLIMKKKVVRKNYLVGRPMVSRRFDKNPEEKGVMPKE